MGADKDGLGEGANADGGSDRGVAYSSPEEEAAADELSDLLKTGPSSNNRAGGLAFLALVIAVGAGLYFYLSDDGAASFLQQLESELLAHAEVTVANLEQDHHVSVVPAWPYRLYAALRRDIAWYSCAAALAALVWGASVQARARRGIFLVHEKYAKEMAALRERVAELEKSAGVRGPRAR